MPESVIMTHPKLPDRTITARGSQVRAFQKSGWRVKADPTTTDTTDTQAAGDKPATGKGK